MLGPQYILYISTTVTPSLSSPPSFFSLYPSHPSSLSTRTSRLALYKLDNANTSILSPYTFLYSSTCSIEPLAASYGGKIREEKEPKTSECISDAPLFVGTDIYYDSCSTAIVVLWEGALAMQMFRRLPFDNSFDQRGRTPVMLCMFGFRPRRWRLYTTATAAESPILVSAWPRLCFVAQPHLI